MNDQHEQTANSFKKSGNQNKPQEQQGSQQKDGQDEQLIERIPQNLLIYILMLIATLVAILQNVLIIYDQQNEIPYMSQLKISILAAKCLVWIITIGTVVTLRKALTYVLLMDNILISQCSASTVFISLKIIQADSIVGTIDVIFYTLFAISQHLQSSSFRVVISNCKWHYLQTIIYKLAVMAVIIFYLGFGCYFFNQGYSFTNGRDSKMDIKMKDLIILYTFANFAYFMEIFSKVTNFDGSGMMESHYQLINQKQTISQNDKFAQQSKSTRKHGEEMQIVEMEGCKQNMSEEFPKQN